ncbi:hypothetical protein [Streptococcus parasanguinis]|uniref:hypothetical protein n=1 Tax=Streptococcus parasanguinis TaxID=1318 RepID=UPI0019610D6B|nr:hypothetical protein [Streptococcus parasanguinis]
MDISQTGYERMQARQFVTVQDSRYPEDEVSFNLKTHELYSSTNAIKNGKIYVNSVYTPTVLYKSKLEDMVTYGIMNIPITKRDILDHQYTLEFKASKFINQNNLSDIKKGYIENYYVYDKMSKVRVTYNKEFLPIKLEGYYEKNGEMSWNTIRTYLYPFKNKSDFDKKLDEQIQLIKEFESEKED